MPILIQERRNKPIANKAPKKKKKKKKKEDGEMFLQLPGGPSAAKHEDPAFDLAERTYSPRGRRNCVRENRPFTPNQRSNGNGKMKHGRGKMGGVKGAAVV